MNKRNTQKTDLLLKTPQNLFHTRDLALLWGIDNDNTLHTTISRYIEKGVLIRLRRGFYSKVPVDQLDRVRIGMAYLHSYSYLSTESILCREGVISQSSSLVTLVSRSSRRFEINGTPYLSRQMKDEYLFNQAGVKDREAGLERAVADILYFNPSFHADAASLVDWEKVKRIKNKIGY